MIRRARAWWQVRRGNVPEMIARIATGGAVRWK